MSDWVIKKLGDKAVYNGRSRDGQRHQWTILTTRIPVVGDVFVTERRAGLSRYPVLAVHELVTGFAVETDVVPEIPEEPDDE